MNKILKILNKIDGETPDERLKGWIVTNEATEGFAALLKTNTYTDDWKENFAVARKTIKEEPDSGSDDEGLLEASDIARAGRQCLLPEYGLTPNDVQIIDDESNNESGEGAWEIIELISEKTFVKDLSSKPEIKLYELEGIPVVKVPSYDPDWYPFCYIIPKVT